MFDYRPLVFFWIAEFSDGTAISQFDPSTGKENKANPDWLPSKKGQPKISKNPVYERKKLVRFGWYPFTPKLSRTIFEKTGLVTIPSNNLPHVINLKNGERLLAKRENIIKFNLKGAVTSREITYVLGKIGGKVLRIREDGSVE